MFRDHGFDDQNREANNLVELMEEGTPCWRPVDAEYLGNEIYRIVGQKPEDEIWAFSAGDVVKCKLKAFQEA